MSKWKKNGSIADMASMVVRNTRSLIFSKIRGLKGKWILVRLPPNHLAMEPCSHFP